MKGRSRGPARPAPGKRAANPRVAVSPEARQLFDQGLRHSESGDDEGAAAAFHRVIGLRPDLHQAHFNLGRALDNLARDEEALAAFERVLALQPDHPKAILQLAQIRHRRGELAESIRLYERAVRLDPQDAALVNDLGVALGDAGRDEEAAEAFRRALTLAPDLAPVHRNLGNVVRKLEGDAAAVRHYTRAVELDPEFARAWEGLGSVYHRTEPEEAARCYREALARAPGNLAALHGLLAIEQRTCDFDAAEATHASLLDAVARSVYRSGVWRTAANLVYESLFMPLPADALRALQDHIAVRLEREVRAQGPLPEFPPSRPTIVGRLRVGYLSPSFGDHPVGHVTLSLFPAHDRQRLEVHAFSTRRGGSDGSEQAVRHRTAFDAFHEIGGKSSREAAAYIRSLGIDLLVDLDGYMDNTSPPILAFRPAPLQVFWLGHAGGLGLPFVDYLIADATVIPPGEEGGYREAVVRLPDTYHCADRHPIAAGCPPRPAWDLPEEAVVYCAFNNPDKIDRRVFDCWMRILKAVDGSVLWLSSFRQRRSTLLANLRRYAERQGVDPSRLILSERVPDKARHLARLGHADLMLDTLTVNASTTALDGLWAGVPLLAVGGDRFSNRISSSMLHAIGLGDLVCADLDEYERRAVQLGQDLAGRSEIRRRLRESREITPLFDSRRFVQNLERAFQVMWDRHCRGEPPRSFDLPPVAAG